MSEERRALGPVSAEGEFSSLFVLRNEKSSFEERVGDPEPQPGLAEDVDAVAARRHELILGRPTDEYGRDDRVRLTRLNASGLSVKRHTGRWERTPFSGSMAEMVEVIWTLMPHLVAPH